VCSLESPYPAWSRRDLDERELGGPIELEATSDISLREQFSLC
jgi:hypothetical protein